MDSETLWYLATSVLVVLVTIMFYRLWTDGRLVAIGTNISDGTRSLLLRNGFYDQGSDVFEGPSAFETLGNRFTLDQATEQVTGSLLGAMSASTEHQ